MIWSIGTAHAGEPSDVFLRQVARRKLRDALGTWPFVSLTNFCFENTVVDEIRSHQFEIMVQTIVCWYLQGNHQKPGFLRWRMISSIHSRKTPQTKSLFFLAPSEPRQQCKPKRETRCVCLCLEDVTRLKRAKKTWLAPANVWLGCGNMTSCQGEMHKLGGPHSWIGWPHELVLV